MGTDLNLLFGVLALHAGLIDARQYDEACSRWATRKDALLADLLLKRGWLVPADRAHLDYLLRRSFQKHGGDSRASLAGAPDDVRRSLAALGGADLQRNHPASDGLRTISKIGVRCRNPGKTGNSERTGWHFLRRPCFPKENRGNQRQKCWPTRKSSRVATSNTPFFSGISH
jgi:hypothetical protein